MLLYEDEKKLLVIICMYAGKKGIDEFDIAIDNKTIYDDQRDCLTSFEMVDILKKIEMDDPYIILSIYNIFNGDRQITEAVTKYLCEKGSDQNEINKEIG